MVMATQSRPDEDIELDIQRLIKSYPPLNNDRHHLNIGVAEGKASISGHLKTPMTRRYLISAVQRVPGVASVSSDGLYDDETIRLQAGKMVPPGVLVSSDYGVMVLAGKLDEASRDALIKKLEQIAGVKRVVTAGVTS